MPQKGTFFVHAQVLCTSLRCGLNTVLPEASGDRVYAIGGSLMRLVV